MRNILSVLLVVTLFVFCSFNAFAYESQISLKNDTIYLDTLAIPQAATDYAKDIFSHLHAYDFKAIGFTDSELNNLSLSPGFCMVNAYTGDYIDNVYYFLIKSNNNFVASLVVNNYNGEYGYQISKSDFSRGMNDIERNTECANKVILEQGAYYCYSKDSSVSVISSNNNSMTRSDEKISDAFNHNMYSTNATTSVSVDVLSNIAEEPANLNATNTYYMLNIPGCDNKYAHNNIQTTGTCWASVAGSICSYLLNGNNATRSNAEQLRDTILDIRYYNTSPNTITGGLNEIYNSIRLITGVNYASTYGTLPFSTIATLISVGRPSVLVYVPVLGAGTDNHVVVLKGVSYLSTDINDTNYQAYYIMDPNHPSDNYTLVGYNSAYVDNDMLVWCNGQYVHPIYLWSNTGIQQ